MHDRHFSGTHFPITTTTHTVNHPPALSILPEPTHPRPQCAGDPVSMKEFVVAVHERAGQARAGGQLSQRATMLLELVVDVKNNR